MLIRIEIKVGYGVGKFIMKIIVEIIDEFVFLLRNFKIELFENFGN